MAQQKLVMVSFIYALASIITYDWTKCAAAVIPLTENIDTGVLNYLAYELPRQLDKNELIDDPYVRLDKAPEPVTLASEGSSAMLQCEAIGIPPPVIYWRKNGMRIQQAERDNEGNAFEKLTNMGSRTVESSTTVGTLRLDCVDASMAGMYECIAENGHAQTSNVTQLVVMPKDASSPAMSDACAEREVVDGRIAVSPTIFMFTEFRFENEGNNAQLYCRANGFPKPQITWLDNDAQPLEMDENRYVLPNGDLFIRNVQGYAQYFCKASNEAGEDKIDTFVYATAE